MRSIRCDTAQGKQMWILERKFRVITSLSGFSRKAMYLHGTSVEAQLFPWQINTHASNIGVGNGVRNVSIASGQVIYNYSYLNVADQLVFQIEQCRQPTSLAKGSRRPVSKEE